MANQTVFKRYELKYLLSTAQRAQLLQEMAAHMALDQYGHSTIRNIYYDTDTYRLIRRSLERPLYKEKLRVRSYHQAKGDSDVFVELKKKYKSVVYKRRVVLQEEDAIQWLGGVRPCPRQTQIAQEIDYFQRFYQTLHPVVFLSYEREAFYSLGGDDFRVTLDENILFREEELSLRADVYGTPILGEGQSLMELKASGGLPLWMTQLLTSQRLQRTSFSKYGTAYRMMCERNMGGKLYA